MGAILKGLAFLVGLSMLGLGAGLLSLPLFLYAFWGLLFGRKRSQGRYGDSHSKPARGGIGKRAALGIVLLIFAAIAIAQGGRFSVLLFGGSGLLLLFWNHIPWKMPGSAVRPIRESILLRSTLVPFRWVSISEVKFLTRNVAGVLSSINEPILIDASKGSVYLMINVLALDHSQALQKSCSQSRDIASVLSQLDAYLVPLDSQDARALLGTSLKEVKIDPENWKNSVQTLPYDLLALNPKSGVVATIGLYRRTGEKSSSPRTISPSRRISMPPMLWEVIKALEQRMPWPDPDDVAGFVASLSATRGEPLALRLDGNLSGETVQTVTTMGREVEFQPSQLRAMVAIYG
jgi:hypothetical protein